MPRWVVAAAFAIPVLFLGVFYLWPATTLIARTVSGQAVTDGLASRRTWRIAWFTLWQAGLSTVLTIAAGMLPAGIIARFRFPGRRLLSATMTAIFVLPSVVVGAAVLAVTPSALAGSVVPILFAHVLFNLAVVVRTVGAVWERLGDDLDHAAATLGASPWRVRWEVTWPLLRPAVLAAASIVFAFCFTSYGVIRVLGGGHATLEVEIWRRAIQGGNVGAASVVAILQIVLLAVVVVTANRLQRRAAVALALGDRPRRRRPRAGRQAAGVAAIALATAAVIATPLVALARRSLVVGGHVTLAAWRQLGSEQSVRGIRTGVQPLEALTTSLRIAAVAAVVATVVGVLGAAAIDLAQRAGRLLDVGLMLPLVTSAVTVGFGMLITFDSPPVDWRASWWIIPLGHALIGIPFVTRATLSVVRAIDPQLQFAAGTLGASPWRAWREVVAPRLWRPAAIGFGLAAAVSLGEFGATSVLSRAGTTTLPMAIDSLLGRSGSLLHAQGSALAVLLAVVTIGIAALVEGPDRAVRP